MDPARILQVTYLFFSANSQWTLQGYLKLPIYSFCQQSTALIRIPQITYLLSISSQWIRISQVAYLFFAIDGP